MTFKLSLCLPWGRHMSSQDNLADPHRIHTTVGIQTWPVRRNSTDLRWLALAQAISTQKRSRSDAGSQNKCPVTLASITLVPYRVFTMAGHPIVPDTQLRLTFFHTTYFYVCNVKVNWRLFKDHVTTIDSYVIFKHIMREQGTLLAKNSAPISQTRARPLVMERTVCQELSTILYFRSG